MNEQELTKQYKESEKLWDDTKLALTNCELIKQYNGTVYKSAVLFAKLTLHENVDVCVRNGKKYVVIDVIRWTSKYTYGLIKTHYYLKTPDKVIHKLYEIVAKFNLLNS